MNINMLLDADNDAGFYAAANGGTTVGWRGAALLRSADGGANFSIIGSFDLPATMGLTVNALGNFFGGNIPDELNTLTVSLSYGALSSTNYEGLLNGAQAAVVGDEIVNYREAALNTDGTFTLRGFLRGRRGSEYAMGLHQAGERVVFLTPGTIKRIADTTASIGVERMYRAVTAGTSNATNKTFTNVGAGLKPYSVVQLGGGRNAAGDALISWRRRGRISGEWRDSVDVPLSEESEAYVVEIWNAGRTSVIRTISDLTTPSATYTAADQVADFGSLQPSLQMSVYQLSAIVGRGYEARVTL